MILLSDSRTFLYLTPEWAGVIVSIFALFFAWLGYRQLIKSKGDTEAQIKSLADQAKETAKVAKHMETMAKTTVDNQRAIRIREMPWFNSNGSELTHGNRSLTVGLYNMGQTPAIDCIIENLNPASSSFPVIAKPRVNPGDSFPINWFHEQPTISDVRAYITFKDSYGKRYRQDINMFGAAATIHPAVEITE